jgi:dTDP-4-dehydrorhamnose reductase
MAEAGPLRIVLLGAQGQLGHALAQTLPVWGEVLAFGRQQADLAHADALRAVLDQHQPQLIVNAAAYTAVDKAEQEPDVAHAINAQAPAVLAQWAAAHGAVLVHYSTDYVFDGQSPQPYAEVDVPAPQSVYGQSKWAGERAVQVALGRHLVFRTSWVVGAHGGNFLKTMLRLGTERDNLRVVADQHGAPTAGDVIARTTLHGLQHMMDPASVKDAQGRVSTQTPVMWASADDPRWGLYHLAAAGETTWHGYANQVLALARLIDSAIKIKATEVVPVPTSAFPTAARRPLNSRLDCQKLQGTFGLALPKWEGGLGRMMGEVCL